MDKRVMIGSSSNAVMLMKMQPDQVQAIKRDEAQVIADLYTAFDKPVYQNRAARRNRKKGKV